jgi:hypothetical protein
MIYSNWIFPVLGQLIKNNLYPNAPMHDFTNGHEKVLAIADEWNQSTQTPNVGWKGVALEELMDFRSHVGWSTLGKNEFLLKLNHDLHKLRERR